jgi:hypothetical protein
MSATLRSSGTAVPAEAMRATASASGLRRKLKRDPLDLIAGASAPDACALRAAGIRPLSNVWSLALD